MTEIVERLERQAVNVENDGHVSAARAMRDAARILATDLVAGEAEIRADQREIDAKIADEHSFGREIDWWLNATKKDVAAETCRSVAAAIRSGGGE